MSKKKELPGPFFYQQNSQPFQKLFTFIWEK
jgi:hypothetical protein